MKLRDLINFNKCLKLKDNMLYDYNMFINLFHQVLKIIIQQISFPKAVDKKLNISWITVLKMFINIFT